MGHKSQLVRSADQAPSHLPIKAWGTSPSNLQDMKFLRSWLVYDSELPRRFIPGRVNWNLVLGLLSVVAISASFWAGIGLMIARVWK
jgi:hypothetical protein